MLRDGTVYQPKSDAREQIEAWRTDYNPMRLHNALEQVMADQFW